MSIVRKPFEKGSMGLLRLAFWWFDYEIFCELVYMKTTLHIKNMVCNRCKSTVVRELKALGLNIESVELGQVILKGEVTLDYASLERMLNQNGFELIKEETALFIEELKIALIERVEYQKDTKLSSFLSQKFNASYSALSKLFSRTEGITIEKYEINLKIEKVKELIQLGQLNFSEIAYHLNYQNSAHLSKQFKSVTGMSMTDYKQLQNWDRKPLDQIV